MTAAERANIRAAVDTARREHLANNAPPKRGPRKREEGPVTITYLRFRIVLLDQTHLTIYTPDGRRIVAGVPMTLSSARRVIRGYRAATLDERTAA